MGTLYFHSGGSATNGGSSDNNAADLSGSAGSNAGAVITLDGSPDLSGVQTSGANQAAIFLAGVTVYNTDSRIFWITAADNVAKTVDVTPTPAGTMSGAWAIGGRVTTPQLGLSPMRPGDELIIDEDYSAAGTIMTARVEGTISGGLIRVTGKTGARRAITCTNTSNCFSSAVDMHLLSNLEFIQQGASGNAVAYSGGASVWLSNVKVSDAGGDGVAGSSGTTSEYQITDLEVSGCVDDGITGAATSTIQFRRVNSHDNGGDGCELTGAGVSGTVDLSIFDSNTGRGFYCSSASVTTAETGITFDGCIFNTNGSSGLEAADADQIFYSIENCIFRSNGDAAGEYNLEHPGTVEAFGSHRNNCFYQGGGSAGNVLGLTTNATEVTTDPLFTDPDNRDFTLQAGSPCIGTGTPGTILGATGTGYMDMGPFQVQASSSPRPFGGSVL